MSKNTYDTMKDIVEAGEFIGVNNEVQASSLARYVAENELGLSSNESVPSGYVNKAVLVRDEHSKK